MRFVLGNRLLDHAGGTEVHLVTLGEQLQRLGHEVWLYSPQLGPFSDEAGRRGLEVVGSLRELPEECDVVFAQDTIVSYDLAHRYPQALAVFRVCGDVYDFQLSPQLPDVVDLIVVLSDRYARLVAGAAVQAPVLRLQVPIDLVRLEPRGRIRERPRRAALLGNYPERTEVVTAACDRRGIEVTRVGGTQQSFDLASALADVDIVFAKSRAALDAMACGRAVYILDIFGGDAWVTPQSYGALEADNFAGLATDRIVSVDELERDLALYDPAMGAANRDLIVQHHDPRGHALALLEAITGRAPAARPAAPLRELGRLTELGWSWQRVAAERRDIEVSLRHALEAAQGQEARAVAAAASAAQARADAEARIGELESQLAEARRGEDPRELRAELDAMRGTRVWRLAVRYWRLRARLRDRIS